MTSTRFTFHFYVTCTRKTKPYVARIQWNAATQKITREPFPTQHSPFGRSEEIAECYFTVSVGEIIETCRGGNKKRQYRALYLVAPTGYLIMLAMADEANDVLRIMEYLDGKMTASELSQGRWQFETVTSEWRGAPEHNAAAPATRPYMDILKDQAAQLQARLSKVNALIHDDLPPSAPQAPHMKRITS